MPAYAIYEFNHCGKWLWRPRLHGAYGILYKVTNILNGKKYIGITVKSLERRASVHVASAARVGRKAKFAAALKSYGTGNFYWKVIGTAKSKEELIELEKTYIRSLAPEYNLTLGGDGGFGRTYSPEQRKTISLRMTEWHKNNKGKINYTLTPEQALNRANVTRERLRKYGQHPNALLGLAAAREKRKRSVRDLFTGKVYDCPGSAAADTGYKRATVRWQAIHGIHNKRFALA